VHDDEDKPIGGDTSGGQMRYFRNVSAQTYLAKGVVGFFGVNYLSLADAVNATVKPRQLWSNVRIDLQCSFMCEPRRD
jgi:hypothetical protein